MCMPAHKDTMPLIASPDGSQEYGGHRVRRVDLASGVTTTLAGSRSAGLREGVGASALFNAPWGVAIDPSGTFALVGVRPPTVDVYTPAPRHRSRRCGTHPLCADRGTHTCKHTAYVAHHTTTGHNAAARDLRFSSSSCSCVFSGIRASQDLGNSRIRRVELPSGETTTFAGSTQGYRDGVGTDAQFNSVHCIAIDPSGTFALVSVRACGLGAPSIYIHIESMI